MIFSNSVSYRSFDIFQMLRCGSALAYKIVSIPRHLPEVFCLLSSNRPAATYPTNPTCRRLPYIRNQYKSLYRRALIIPASLQYKFLSAGRFSCLPLSACAAAACGFFPCLSINSITAAASPAPLGLPLKLLFMYMLTFNLSTFFNTPCRLVFIKRLRFFVVSYPQY